MARNITVTFSDGSTHKYNNAPDDITPDAVMERASREFGKEIINIDGGRQSGSLGQKALQAANDIGGGLLKGASNIGNTLLSAGDAYNELVGNKYALSKLDSTGKERRQKATDALKTMGANPESDLYKAGELGAEIAGTAGLPVSTGANILKNAAVGAASGAASAGLVDPENALTGGVVGGAFPVAAKGVAMVGNKLGNAIAPAVSEEVKQLALKAKQHGIDVPLDRLVNSKPLNAIAQSLNYIPFSGREATEERLGKQINKAASRLVGEDTDNIVKALRNADVRLGGIFDDTLKNNKVTVDDELLNGLSGIEELSNRTLGQNESGIINRQIAEILKKGETGKIDGQAAYNIKRELDMIGKGSGTEAHVAKELKVELIGALNRSLGGEKAAEFAKTRQQYSNMLKLEPLAQNGADGEISIARLGNMKVKKNPDMQEIADIAAQFGKTREGQHGSMQRAVLAATGLGMGGVPGIAAGVGTARIVNALLNSDKIKQSLLQPNISQPLLSRALQKALPVAAPYAVNE